MSARELVEWQIYAQTRPFGEEQEDRRAALIAQSLFTALQGTKAPPIDNFLKVLRPDPPKEIEPQSPGDLRSRMLGLANRGKDKQPKQEAT